MEGNILSTRSNSKRPTKGNRARAKEWYDNIKNSSCCSWCKESHPATLEFHHINPEDKLYNISTMVHKGMNLTDIFNEAAKCEILCANCHRIWHYEVEREKKNEPKLPTKQKRKGESEWKI